MPIRRPRAQRQTLRHLPFLDALARCAPQDAEARGLTATLLTLRLLDEWRRSGAVVVAPESQALRATRDAIFALAQDRELGAALGRALDAMVMLQEPDTFPLVMRLEAVADVFASRQRPLLADCLRAALADAATTAASSPAPQPSGPPPARHSDPELEPA